MIRVMRMRRVDVPDVTDEIMSLLIAHEILVLILAVDRRDIKLQIALKGMRINPLKQRIEIKS